MRRIEYLCGHCRCVVATGEGDWNDAFGLEDLGLLCGDCARCDKAPACRELLEAVLDRRGQ
jgi:hypothetical protein